LWSSIHFAVFKRRHPSALPDRCDLPQAFAPLQSFTRAPWHPTVPDFPEVPRPHSATHSLRSTTPRRFLPGSRCVLALTMCRDAFLPQRAPWCPFNQVRSRDFALQSLTEQRSSRLLSLDFPSCDWLTPCRVKQTLSLLRTPPRNWPSVRNRLIGRKAEADHPSRITGVTRLGA
jgi:hypothetical protein